MLKRQLVHESQRRATKNRGVATRLQPGAATQFVRLLVACSLCTYTSGDGGMRKASAWLLEKGIHTEGVTKPTGKSITRMRKCPASEVIDGLYRRRAARSTQLVSYDVGRPDSARSCLPCDRGVCR